MRFWFSSRMRTPKHIVAEANQQLEPYQRIRSFSLWPQPALPRTSGHE